MKKLLFAILALLAIPAHAQVTQSAQINSNTLNTTANIVTLDTNATAISVAVSTTANLSCSTYPVITFIVTRNAVNTTLAVITTSNAASWTATPIFTTWWKLERESALARLPMPTRTSVTWQMLSLTVLRTTLRLVIWPKLSVTAPPGIAVLSLSDMKQLRFLVQVVPARVVLISPLVITRMQLAQALLFPLAMK